MRYISILISVFVALGPVSAFAKSDRGAEQKKTKKSMNDAGNKAEAVSAAPEKTPEAKEFKNPQHAENMAYLEEKMSESKMTGTQKAELADHFEKQFPEDTSFKSAEQKENAEFLGKLAGDPTMTMQEKKLAIRNLRDSQKKEFKTIPAGQSQAAGEESK